MEITQFREKLEEAFADAPYPGDDNLTECPCPECQEIAEYFRGKTWRGHTVRNLRYHEAALNLLTAEAVHYFLPAFVLAELEDPEEADVIYDGLIFIFTPSGSSRQKENIKLLSKAQSEVMIDYLRYCLAEEGEYLDNNITEAITALSRK